MTARGILAVCACAAAAALLSALAVAAGAAVGSPGTTTTTTTTTTAPATTTPRGAPVTPPPLVVPEGITIGGVSVGGFTPSDAQHLIETRFLARLPVVLGARRLLVRPAALGATARVRSAVERALASPPGSDLSLTVTVNRTRLRAYLRSLARRFDRPAQDSEVSLRGLRPFVTEGRPGRRVAMQRSANALVAALTSNSRAPVVLPFREFHQRVTRANFGPVIVIRRGQKRLWLYRGMKLWRTFGVAVGQPSWPTPIGRFEIVVKWRNPWWFPPNSSWARGSAPIPPGPDNPLGTRWMGLSSPGVGIHGTPNPSSIGYSASHGCIRMRIPDAEWLFEHVDVGTTVFIVRA